MKNKEESDSLNTARECLRVAVDTLIEIANTDTNQISKVRARETISEIKRILDK